MPLLEQRLTVKIEAVINKCRTDEGTGDTAKNTLAADLAKAIVEEIKNLNINYISGLTVDPQGKVIGVINATII